MIIYKTTNIINNKIYIGQDSKNNPKYLGSGTILNHAIKKYGKENFKKEILEYCTDKIDMDKKERYWIETLNSRDRKIGYNITKGGDGCLGCTNKGIIFTKEHRDNISKNHHDVSGDNNPMFGKNHSNNAKNKIKIANIGRIPSLETRIKMGEKKKGNSNNNSKLTEQQVLLIRDLWFIDGKPQTEIAKQFNVEKACVNKIVSYRTWKHI